MRIEITFDSEAQAYLAYLMYLFNEKMDVPKNYESLRSILHSFKGGVEELRNATSIEDSLKDCDIVDGIFKGLSEKNVDYYDVKNAIKSYLSEENLKHAHEDADAFKF